MHFPAAGKVIVGVTGFAYRDHFFFSRIVYNRSVTRVAVIIVTVGRVISIVVIVVVVGIIIIIVIIITVDVGVGVVSDNISVVRRRATMR